MPEFIYQMHQGPQGARRQGHPRRRHAVVLPRRQDRRRGAQRHGQVHPAQDHGRPRGGHERRGAPHARLLRGHPACRNRPSTRTRRSSRTSRMAFGDIFAQGRALQRHRRWRWPSPTPTSTRSWRRWASCRPRSTPPTAGTLTASSPRPWTRCSAPTPTSRSTVLSGGERRRVALCRLLLEAPDLLLLDEPTNHLDAESVLWLEQFLRNYPGAVLAVTHDRYFLDHVAEWICEVDRGQPLPLQGQLLHLPGDEGRPPGGPGPEPGRQAGEDA